MNINAYCKFIHRFLKYNFFPVSYTHLRAHETDSYLVCRLLLEKKKKTISYTKLCIEIKNRTM